MTMFEEAPKTITAMDNRELRQEIWRLKGIIDKQKSQIEAIKHEPKYTNQNLIKSLSDENRSLRRALNMSELKISSTPEEIINSILGFYNVTREQVNSESRKGDIVRPRHILAYALHRKGFSYKTIGLMLGNRDHSTMIHACKKAVIAMEFMTGDELEFVNELLK